MRDARGGRLENPRIRQPGPLYVREEEAVALLSSLCPDREVVPVFAREILLGDDNIHCITRQRTARAGRARGPGPLARCEGGDVLP